MRIKTLNVTSNEDKNEFIRYFTKSDLVYLEKDMAKVEIEDINYENATELWETFSKGYHCIIHLNRNNRKYMLISHKDILPAVLFIFF